MRFSVSKKQILSMGCSAILVVILTGCGSMNYSVKQVPFPVYFNAETPVNVPKLDYYSKEIEAKDKYYQESSAKVEGKQRVSTHSFQQQSGMAAKLFQVYQNHGGASAGTTLVNSRFFMHKFNGTSHGNEYCYIYGTVGVLPGKKAVNASGVR